MNRFLGRGGWWWVLLGAWLAGCASRPQAPAGSGRTFVFERDTLAFANELVSAPGAAVGMTRAPESGPVRPYRQRCFPMVRAVRLFWEHADFDASPGGDGGDDGKVLRSKMASVLRRDPRREPEAGASRVRFEGVDGLRALSRRNESMMKELCGSRLASYVQRGHWRMVLPFGRRGQIAEAERIQAKIRRGRLVIVHVVRFPSMTINHALLLYSVEETPAGWTFLAYDPNEPDRPVPLLMDATSRRFIYSPTRNFAGGWVNVYEVYASWDR